MAETFAFLSHRTDRQIRREIQSLRQSYSHPWDILSELVQNAVDAIRRFDHENEGHSKGHKITVEIDSKKRRVVVSDTGAGFPLKDQKEFEELLAIHGSDKDDIEEEIGEKGIGLKFAVFSCNLFKLESVSVDGSVKGQIARANDWLNSEGLVTPQFEYSSFSNKRRRGEETGTTITLEDVEPSKEGPSFFDLTTAELNCLLRTRTAIGNTNAVFEPGPEIQVNFRHQPGSGKPVEANLPFKFMLPTELLEDESLLDFRKFLEKAATMSDRQKANALRDKTLYMIGKKGKAGRSVQYFLAFVPNRPSWTDIRRRIRPDASEEDADEDHFIGPGIMLATKGMPTGIFLSPPATGYSGYWPNTFLLMQDNALSFDLGRKFVPGRTQGALKEIAKDLFNEITRIAPLIAGTSQSRAGPSSLYATEKSQTFKQFESLNPLNLRSIGFQKYPDGQEAGVVAIFHELVGSGALPQYRSLRQGYQSQYDLWAQYEVRHSDLSPALRRRVADQTLLPIVIEFKYAGESVIKDAQTNTKFFEDIDIIVCWDLDEKKFAKEGIEVRALSEKDRFYYGTFYNLEWPGSYNLGSAGRKAVLPLRRFVEDLATKSNG